ncbi:hypothetical protein HDV05_004570 [Chytridiales sp. JEL 0842]|nr:hypothetical protein HDV05_004570 [Chytridiales sp. JEL 0842]
MGRLKKALSNLKHQQTSKRRPPQLPPQLPPPPAAAAADQPSQLTNKKVKLDSSTTTNAAPGKAKIPKFPFEEDDAILLVGEGNFSFARCLCDILSGTHLTATSYDSQETLHTKYPDSPSNVQGILDLDGKVLYNVDATHLSATKALKGKKFDKVVFNFPHVGAGIKDMARNVETNQILLRGFFESAKTALTPNGLVYVTLKSGEPYDSWQMKLIAKKAGFSLKTKIPFLPDMYPNYVHRRTIGYSESVSTDNNEDILKSKSFTHIFWRKELAQKSATTKRKRKGDDSDED